MTKWLDEDEQALWRLWLRVSDELQAALARQLLVDEKLSLSDFVVLVHLTETPGGRLRASDLAEKLSWERSRLSHHVGRMAQRGLVRRDQATSDRRGAVVAVTDDGRRVIEAAAPGHVAAVRGWFIDVLDEGERADLRRILAKVAEGLDAR